MEGDEHWRHHQEQSHLISVNPLPAAPLNPRQIIRSRALESGGAVKDFLPLHGIGTKQLLHLNAYWVKLECNLGKDLETLLQLVEFDKSQPENLQMDDICHAWMRFKEEHGTLDDFDIAIKKAWSLWNEGKAMDLVDSSLVKRCSPTEALPCIQIGLLCVQDNPNSKPLMSSVVFMLENETMTLSVTKQLFFHKGILKPKIQEKTLAALRII